MEAKPPGAAATMRFKALHGLGVSSARANVGALRQSKPKPADAAMNMRPRRVLSIWALSCLRFVFL
jgi:hypothetical protein